MFSKSITNSSRFLMMPQSSQNLYFHLGMNADDDGFCEHFTIMRMTESKPDDLKILQAKEFIKVFDDKVLVILDWKENNYLRSDRYTPSKYLKIYKEELLQIEHGIPEVNQMDTQDRLGKDRLGKDNNITSADVGIIYSKYPSRCVISNRSTGKTSKNKDKIKALLKNGQTVETLEKLIETYVGDCKKTKTYMKNFATFLNNLPDLNEITQEPKMTRAEEKLLKKIGAL